MGDENNKKMVINKFAVAKSFLLFMILFLVFLSCIPSMYDYNYLSKPLIAGKYLCNVLLILFVALTGASFIYKLLSYIENQRNIK